MSTRTSRELAIQLCEAVGLDASTVSSLVIAVEPGGKISIKASLINDQAMIDAVCRLLSTDKTERS